MELELFTKVNNISIISLSGGLDSTSLLLHLLEKNYKIYALSFNYGQKHSLEIKKAAENIKYLKSLNHNISHKIIDISDCLNLLSSSLTDNTISIPNGHYEEENMKSTVVPNRNAIFTSILYGYALTISKKYKENKILLSLGVHSGDHTIYPDCRPEFYNNIIKAFESGNWDTDKIELHLPYINYDKSQILEDAIAVSNKLNISYNKIFKNTLTSYNPNQDGISDGRTSSDIERILAFNKLGLKDPIEYKEKWDIVLKNALDVERDFLKKN